MSPAPTWLWLLFASFLVLPAGATERRELHYDLRFKAFCRNQTHDLQVVRKNDPIVYPLVISPDGSTRFSETHKFHPIVSAGYEVYVTVGIFRDPGDVDFHIRLTPWRRMNAERDVSYGTAFVETPDPARISPFGVQVSETIDEALGTYCTLTATLRPRAPQAPGVKSRQE